MKTQAEIEKIKKSVDMELEECSAKIKYALKGWEQYSLSLLFEEKTKLTAQRDILLEILLNKGDNK